MKLLNKVVLITGASRGIGAAIATLFAGEGADVALHCRVHDKEEDDQMLKLRQKHGRKVACFEADMTNVREIKRMVDRVKKTFGTIDILVNNAGFYPENSFFESTEKTWSRVMDTNLRSAYFCSQFVSKIMLKQKGGNIINMASVAGVYPRKSSFEYAISKAGMIHFSKSLALILAPHIRVNAIAPSYTWSNFMSFMKNTKKVKEKMKLIPLKGFNEPEDVAKAALFLATEDSRNITGQVIIIDGGRGAGV
ncbi:MAG TPA: SDR family oxidoreductase [Candidatus Gracilibacteria bacterium]|nr:SDR family oxidoreductase [Candidatus Gracilibacteria bacterium]